MRFVWLLSLVLFFPTPISAQQSNQPLRFDLGDAVVSGFSGVVAPDPAQARAANRPAADLTFINPDGPSARIVSIGRPGSIWDGRVVQVSSPLGLYQ